MLITRTKQDQDINSYTLELEFNNVYNRMEIPEQWKLAKITPVHKKGDKTNIHNYRPIANLCAATKIYERLILQRIQEIEKEEDIFAITINNFS